MHIYLVLLFPSLTLNLKPPSSSQFGKGDIPTRLSSHEADLRGDASEKRRANVIEGGRDPANVILRQRRLKVRRTGKRRREPVEDKLRTPLASEKEGYDSPTRRTGKQNREPVEEEKPKQASEKETKLRHASPPRRTEKRKRELTPPHASEVKSWKTDARDVDETGEVRWESLRMYLPSSSFRQIPDNSNIREREIPGRERATTDHKSLVAGKNLVLTERRKEERKPGTKETRTILEEPLDQPVKRISSETGKIALPPLLLLPIVKEIGERTIKRRRLEARNIGRGKIHNEGKRGEWVNKGE